MSFRPVGIDPVPLYWIAAGIMVLALGIAALMLVTAARAGRLEYRLDDGGLTVVWGRPVTVPYAEIQEVRLAPVRAGLFRWVGTALPGLHVGTFNLGGVGRIRLYAGRIGSELVVVETARSGRLGLAPEDPHLFAEELRRRSR